MDRRGNYNRGRRRGRGRRRWRGIRQVQCDLPQPTFIRIEDLEPEKRCVNIRCRIVQDPRLVDDCWVVQVGDSTGVIDLLIKDNIDEFQTGKPLIIRNGFVQMVEERFMRLATNFWGKIDFDATDYKFTVKTSENYSGIEFVLKT